MTTTIRLRNPYFNLVKNGLKTAEVRANKGPFAKLKEGDVIDIESINTKETERVYVTKVERYESLTSVIRKRYRQLFSSLNRTYEQCEELYRNIITRNEEESMGVLCIHIKRFDETTIIPQLDKLTNLMNIPDTIDECPDEDCDGEKTYIFSHETPIIFYTLLEDISFLYDKKGDFTRSKSKYSIGDNTFESLFENIQNPQLLHESYQFDWRNYPSRNDPEATLKHSLLFRWDWKDGKYVYLEMYDFFCEYHYLYFQQLWIMSQAEFQNLNVIARDRL